MGRALMVYDGICSPRVAYPDLHLMRSPWTRARGLIGKRKVNFQSAYLFDRCRTVHTCFMRIPIDVISCDKDMRVLHVDTVDPWRLSTEATKGTRMIIEAAAGSASEMGIRLGCTLSVARFETPDQL